MNARHVIRGSVLPLAAWLVAGPTMCFGADGPRANFVSCPIVRDTASVPCWLAEYAGELYFLTIQSDVTSPVTPPWLGHRVLVEGWKAPCPPSRASAAASSSSRCICR